MGMRMKFPYRMQRANVPRFLGSDFVFYLVRLGLSLDTA
jgi:hypothetical protein